MSAARGELAEAAATPADDGDPPKRRHRHRAPASRRTTMMAGAAGLLVALLIAIPFAADRLSQNPPAEHLSTPQAADPVPEEPSPDGGLDVGSPATAPTASPGTSPTAAPSPSAAAAPAPGPPASFAGIAGQGCRQSASRTGAYTDGTTGWYLKDNGGWGGDGCTGEYWSVPMSGDARRDDPSASVVWAFRTGAVQSGRCVVSVFVPTGNDPRDVAGRPAHYRVEPYGSFTVDQIANRGSWVGAGTFPVRDGRLSVTLLTRGANPDGEHLAAAQVRVSCTAL